MQEGAERGFEMMTTKFNTGAENLHHEKAEVNPEVEVIPEASGPATKDHGGGTALTVVDDLLPLTLAWQDASWPLDLLTYIEYKIKT
jgi:hypothetical protein